MEQFIQLPLWWIRNKADDSFLKSLKWTQGQSHNTAALMVFIAIATNTSHQPTRRNQVKNSTEISYTELTDITSLSRKLVSEGIKKLIDAGLIYCNKENRVNRYTLNSSETLQKGWGKLPAKKLYDSRVEKIRAFKNFTLRNKGELNALKIYFLIIAFRDNTKNYSLMNYDTITEYTGIRREDIPTAISLLAANELIRVLKVESVNRAENKYAITNAYRLVGIDSYNKSNPENTNS